MAAVLARQTAYASGIKVSSNDPDRNRAVNTQQSVSSENTVSMLKSLQSAKTGTHSATANQGAAASYSVLDLFGKDDDKDSKATKLSASAA